MNASQLVHPHLSLPLPGAQILFACITFLEVRLWQNHRPQYRHQSISTTSDLLLTLSMAHRLISSMPTFRIYRVSRPNSDLSDSSAKWRPSTPGSQWLGRQSAIAKISMIEGQSVRRDPSGRSEIDIENIIRPLR
jgi:hypothetical protein